MSKIKIGIAGYGNLGKGVELALRKCPDMELVGVFTRRNPADLKVMTSGTKVYSLDEAEKMADKIDVMILCGGSATDIPKQGPMFAKNFNTIDSFDTHAKVPEYFAAMDKVAKENGNVSIISVGWDPGLFSINRMMGDAILPDGSTYTFWGKGISQGHSDAIRRIKGVQDAKQYTIPVEKAIAEVRSGSNPEFTTREKHIRECFVVAEEGADKAKIEEEIKTMPNYFADYDTIVHFISQEELTKNHSGMPHGGFALRSGKTGINDDTTQIMEFSLKLNSNPEFTSSVLAAYARAAYKMSQNGDKGAKTVLDVAPAMLSPKTAEELRKDFV